MKAENKSNRLALISFICGMTALVSLGLYYTLAAINNIHPPGPFNPNLLFMMDLTVPVRNVFSTVALVAGVLALYDFQKKGRIEKGKWMAWAGLLLGAAWYLVHLVVGLVFLISEIVK